eukprot:1186249-Prorocentrum_minimum.AAC.3
MEPQRNAFRAVTVAHAPGERNSSWYCANCFLYAIQVGTQALTLGFPVRGYEGDLAALRAGVEPPSVSPLIK